MSFAVIIKMVNLKGTVDIQCSIVTKEDDLTWQGVAFYKAALENSLIMFKILMENINLNAREIGDGEIR